MSITDSNTRFLDWRTDVDEQLTALDAIQLTRSEYEQLKNNGALVENQRYCVTDESFYTQNEVNTALSGKAKCSISISATLLANSWSGVNAPFTQELAITGLTESQNGIIDVAHDATITEREIAREAILSVVGQSSGSLTIAADGEMPEFDIPVYIILLG